jgi:HNH endonuclease
MCSTQTAWCLSSLDVADYPHATRKVASWILLGMGRLAKSSMSGSSMGSGPRALLLVDEVGALGHSARHLRGLVGRARESGLGIVLATQGPSDLEAVDRALLPQVLQDTAWQLAFRQGSPQDAERMQALFGQALIDDVAWRSDGLTTTRPIERPRVRVDEWMNALEPGDAWLRVAPIDRGWRQERVRVALPRQPALSSEKSLGKVLGNHGRNGARDFSEVVVEGAPQPTMPRPPRGLPPVPPECPGELVEKMGADILAKVERRWPRRKHELGPSWCGAMARRSSRPRGASTAAITTQRSSAQMRRIEWCGGVATARSPKGLTVDHLCRITLCQRPDHLELVTWAENTRRRHQRNW